MKSIIRTAVVTFLLTVFFPLFAAAHPPANIDIEYDSETGKIAIYIAHFTPNISRHYISKVSVRRNGSVIAEEIFDSQEEAAGRSLRIRAEELETGDTIEVEALCSIYGRKTSGITI